MKKELAKNRGRVKLDLIFNIIVLSFGGFYGTFAAAQITYPLLVTLPLFLRLKRSGRARAMPWKSIILPPTLGLGFLLLLANLLPMFIGERSNVFFIGALVTGLYTITLARKEENKQEALKTNKDYLS